jgi:hypothetical protein
MVLGGKAPRIARQTDQLLYSIMRGRHEHERLASMLVDG